MEWIIFFLAIMAIAFIAGIISASKKEEERKEKGEALDKSIKALQNFTVDAKIVGPENRFAIAFDYSRNKILYIFSSVKYVFGFEDIISVELIEDENVISQKSTGRTIGGALVGGLVAGGVGAIVGGLSGSAKQQKEHRSVKVKMLVRNNSNPAVVIPCFDYRTMTDNNKPVKEGDFGYHIFLIGLECAQKIVDRVSVIIDMVDREMKQPAQNDTPSAESAIDEAPRKPLIQQDPFEEEIKRLKAEGKVIDAVKLVMDNKGLGLGEANDYVKNVQ